MADEATLYDKDPNYQEPENSDAQQSSVLRQRKNSARAQKLINATGNTAKTAGRSMQVAGTATQATGKTMKYTGKGMKLAGKGMERGGQSMISTGTAMSGTGVGVIAGVPLVLAGGAVTGIGAGTQVAGKGLEMSGTAVDEAGRLVRQSGGRLNQLGNMAKGKGDKSSQRDSLKALKHESKLQRALDLKNKLTKGDSGGGGLISNTLQLGTDEMLRDSWFNLIPSFGLTLLWIHAHVLLRFVIGEDVFCKLGHEWASMGGAKSATSKIESKLVNDVIEKAGDKVGLLEVGLLIWIDVIILLNIFIFYTLVTLIVYVMTEPWSAIVTIFTSVIKVFWNLLR